MSSWTYIYYETWAPTEMFVVEGGGGQPQKRLSIRKKGRPPHMENSGIQCHKKKKVMKRSPLGEKASQQEKTVNKTPSI